MKRWLTRLFGMRAADHPSPSVAAALPEHAGASDNAPAAAALDLDLAFFHWLIAPHVSGRAAAEDPVLDELARLARDPGGAAALVPRVPAVIPQLLRSLRDADSGAAELARQVAQDPLLVAEVIREVNSPYYQPTSPIRNLEGAVLLLGQNGLRMLLARVAFRPIISQQASPLARLLAPPLWRQSELCAQAAGLLAPRHGADPFEAYLAGLMHNVGLVVAFRAVEQLVPAGGLSDDDAFGARLVQAARRISTAIADQWQLPAAIGRAIAFVADPDPSPPPLALALVDADQLAKLHLLVRGGQPDFVRAALALAPEARQVYDRLTDQSNPQDP